MLIKFLKCIKNTKGLYIELIYDEDSNKIIYASKYYITQKMSKGSSKYYKDERDKKAYTDDDNIIIETMKKSKKR